MKSLTQRENPILSTFSVHPHRHTQTRCGCTILREATQPQGLETTGVSMPPTNQYRKIRRKPCSPCEDHADRL